jgi:hypothetical protein
MRSPERLMRPDGAVELPEKVDFDGEGVAVVDGRGRGART